MASKNGLEVKESRLGGRGVFTTKAVHRGGRLGRWVGERAATWSAMNDCHACWMKLPDGWRCYTGRGRLRFLNHAPRANSDFRGLELYAIQDIPAGGEVTIDYSNGSGRSYAWEHKEIK